MSNMYKVGDGVVVTGSATTITIDPAAACDLYSVELALIVGSPAAGTTAVTAVPKNGTSETVTSGGTAINIDPTALTGFYIQGRPLKSITLTPSSWTAGVQVAVTVWGRKS